MKTLTTALQDLIHLYQRHALETFSKRRRAILTIVIKDLQDLLERTR